MIQKYKAVYTTERALFHQERALAAVPEILDVMMLRQPDRDELKAGLSDATFLISERAGVIDADIIQASPSLKCILRLGSLTYDIDLETAKAAGIAVCYWPDVGVIRVAEHIIMQMLTLAKKLQEVQAIALAASDEWGESRRTDEDTFAYNWSRRESIGQIFDRTVGIIGFGEIGVEVARRLQGWGCQVLYNKRRRLPEHVEKSLSLTYASTDEVVNESDILINLLPYFPETDMSINADTFNRMKTGALVVSCGSGSVIDETALADAVKGGKLGGAALDTYEWEPIRSDNPLVALATSGYNVVLTPHTAAGSYTAEISAKERKSDYTNILRFLDGLPLINRVI